MLIIAVARLQTLYLMRIVNSQWVYGTMSVWGEPRISVICAAFFDINQRGKVKKKSSNCDMYFYNHKLVVSKYYQWIIYIVQIKK